MDCKHIEGKLPAYLEGALPPDEGTLVEGHIAACPNCRRALEDLVKADKLTRGLEEAEPPPWLKQKIMAAVREESGRREGFLRKLFYPLHIKIPATALATVLIAVFAVYVFRAVEPETRYLHQVPSEQARVARDKEIPKSPEAVTPPKLAVPEVRGGKGGMVVPEADQEGERKPVLTESKEAAKKPPEQTLAERKVAERPEAAPGVSAGAVDQQAGVAKRTMAPAKKEEALYGAAMKDEVRAPAAAVKVKTAAPEKLGYTYSLYVGDPAAVMGDVERILTESGARKITRELREGKGIVTAEIEAGKSKAIFEKLKLLGEAMEKGKVPEPAAGPVGIKIEVLAGP